MRFLALICFVLAVGCANQKAAKEAEEKANQAIAKMQAIASQLQSVTVKHNQVVAELAGLRDQLRRSQGEIGKLNGEIATLKVAEGKATERANQAERIVAAIRKKAETKKELPVEDVPDIDVGTLAPFTFKVGQVGQFWHKDNGIWTLVVDRIEDVNTMVVHVEAAPEKPFILKMSTKNRADGQTFTAPGKWKITRTQKLFRTYFVIEPWKKK